MRNHFFQAFITKHAPLLVRDIVMAFDGEFINYASDQARTMWRSWEYLYSPTVKPMNLKLAHLMILTSGLREASYDVEASLLRPGQSHIGADYSQFYKLSLKEAAEIVCKDIDPHLACPIYLALNNSWNDMLTWADITITGNSERVS